MLRHWFSKLCCVFCVTVQVKVKYFILIPQLNRLFVAGQYIQKVM